MKHEYKVSALKAVFLSGTIIADSKEQARQKLIESGYQQLEETGKPTISIADIEERTVWKMTTDIPWHIEATSNKVAGKVRLLETFPDAGHILDITTQAVKIDGSKVKLLNTYIELGEFDANRTLKVIVDNEYLIVLVMLEEIETHRVQLKYQYEECLFADVFETLVYGPEILEEMGYSTEEDIAEARGCSLFNDINMCSSCKTVVWNDTIACDACGSEDLHEAIGHQVDVNELTSDNSLFKFCEENRFTKHEIVAVDNESGTVRLKGYDKPVSYEELA